jgi:asparagine synthase (glutamine-hydrolysing)
MCGIVGLLGPWPEDLLSSLNRTLRHRGPDDSGEFRDRPGEVALAMNRLSILDLERGQQPMSSPDGALVIVHNGEIYNSPELRARLEARGYRFQSSNSDTECLLHLYAEKGEAMLADLNGMFAFILYDRPRRRIFAARDRFGIKPLYYSRPAGRLALASELKTLLGLPTARRELDRESLYHYLSLRYVPGPRSIFQDIWKLPAAHYLVYDLAEGSLQVSRYWRADPNRRESHRVEEWAEIIRAELKAAVRRWVLSDVPVACSLSGGLDSTALVGLLAESGYPRIRTYSLGFRSAAERAWDELDRARRLAERWGTDHHELSLGAEELLHDLVRMVWHLDEPYGGGLPSWYVFRFMSRDVKVGLTGTGGDELFGNYGKWKRYEESLPGHRPTVARRARRLAGRLPARLLGRARKLRWSQPAEAFARPMDAYSLYLDDAVKRGRVVAFASNGIPHTSDWLQRLYDETGAEDARSGFSCVDLETQLPEEFLLMTDRFSMAHSLEARVPFLDPVFVERVLGIPPEIRTRAQDLKYLLKKAVGHLLPPELLRAPKRGFVIPDTLWLRGKLRPLVERLLAPERLERQGLLRSEVYSLFVQPHLEGRADFTGQVWTLLMFQLWHVVFVERRSIETPTFSWADLAQ